MLEASTWLAPGKPDDARFDFEGEEPMGVNRGSGRDHRPDAKVRPAAASVSRHPMREALHDLVDELARDVERRGRPRNQAEQKAQNRQLEDTRDLLEPSRSLHWDLYDSAPVAYLTLDRSGFIEEINLTGASLLGAPRRRLIGFPLVRLLRPDQGAHFRDFLLQCIGSNELRRVDMVLPGANTPDRTMELTCRPWRNRYLVLLTDVTERRRVEAERAALLQLERDARALAEAACKIKDEFLATVTHELKSPLAALSLWTDVLRHVVDDDRKRIVAIDAIDACARAQAKLVDDLLDVSRSMYGKLRLDLRIVDAGHVVGEAVKAYSGRCENGVALEFEDSGPAPVKADPIRLRQIVDNLLSNAAKFTPASGQIDVSVQCVGEQVRIVVGNSGQGIDPEFLPHVFEPFRQENGTSTRPYGGLGLGLAIVRALVRLHEGEVEAASGGAGEGATFTVKLPRVLGDADQREAREKDAVRAPIRTDAPLRGLRVLVVEDDDLTREGLRLVIERSGGDVAAVGSAEEALARFAAGVPHVIVSDIAMPGRDGLSLIQEIRSQDGAGKYVPAYALTARTREGDRQVALAAGFQQVFAKPVEAEELVAALVSVRWTVRSMDGDRAG
jgi:signal transduction histidine kinase/ActR/RegA family two-component response regulator